MKVRHVVSQRGITVRKWNKLAAKAAVVEAMESRLLLSASLVKDINRFGAGSEPNGPSSFVDLNGVAFRVSACNSAGSRRRQFVGTGARRRVSPSGPRKMSHARPNDAGSRLSMDRTLRAPTRDRVETPLGESDEGTIQHEGGGVRDERRRK